MSKLGSLLSSMLTQRSLTILSVATFIFAFHISYKCIISPNYAHQGFSYANPNTGTLFIIAILATLPAVILPMSFTKPSTFVLWMLYLMVYVPAQLIMIYTDNVFSLQQGPFQLALAGAMFFLSFVPHLPRLPLLRARLSPRVFWMFVTMYMAIAYLLLIKTFGFKGIVTNLTAVYDVRLEARDVLASAGRWIGYQLRWLAEAVNPLLITAGLFERSRPLFLIGILGQIIIFSFDATKSTLGSILLVIGIYYLANRFARVHAYKFVLSLVAILSMTAIYDYLIKAPVLTGLLTRRIFAVPGLLTTMYFEYFSTHPFFYWTHTIYGKVLGYSSLYPEYSGPGFLIGATYFHNSAGNANANLWADGYANAGYVGIAISTTILFFILWLYDSVSRGKDNRFVLPLIAMPAFAITNTSMLTSLLSHGWIVAILLVWLYPYRKVKI